MSKVEQAMTEFLESGGNKLGYSQYDMPEFALMEIVLRHSVYVWEYHGQTEEEYYGGVE